MIQNKSIIQIGKGNFVLHSFSTEKDLKLCEKTIERLLNVMAEMSFSEIIKTLSPYREKQAKNIDRELKMTNREWLNSLTDEEYAQEILEDLTCYINASARDICWKETCGCHKECLSCAIRWLKMEHE